MPRSIQNMIFVVRKSMSVYRGRYEEASGWLVQPYGGIQMGGRAVFIVKPSIRPKMSDYQNLTFYDMIEENDKKCTTLISDGDISMETVRQPV